MAITSNLCRLFSALIALALMAPTHVLAVPLFDLLAGGSIQVGHLTFSGWGLRWNIISEGDSVNPPPSFESVDLKKIDVQPLAPSLANPNPGIAWVALDGALLAELGTVFENGFDKGKPVSANGRRNLDLWIYYDVSAAIGSPQLIEKSLLELTDAVTDSGRVDIQEGLDAFAVAAMFVQHCCAAGNIPFDQAMFAPLSSALVDTIIHVEAQGPSSSANLRSFEQRFNGPDITIPEPATLLLLGAGILGLACRKATSPVRTPRPPE